MTNTDDLQRTRIQTRFRGANNLVAAQSERRGVGLGAIVAFICECGNPSCAEPVAAPFFVYWRVRAVPYRFLVATGHVDVSCEFVVEQTPRYQIVEKTVPEARAVAAEGSAV